MNLRISLAPLQDYPPLIGMRHIECLFYWLNRRLLEQFPQTIEKKKFRFSFFIFKDGGFVYAITRAELDLWKQLKNKEKYLKHLTCMFRHLWEKDYSIVGELLNQRKEDSFERYLYIYKTNWLSEAEMHMKKLKAKKVLYHQRSLITNLEKMIFGKTYKYLLDIPVYNPHGEIIAAVQILSEEDINEDARAYLTHIIWQMAPAVWLATEIDRLQSELLTELPISIFLGQYVEKLTAEDAYKILEYSRVGKNE